jgi:hypothetical protein
VLDRGLVRLLNRYAFSIGFFASSQPTMPAGMMNTFV